MINLSVLAQSLNRLGGAVKFACVGLVVLHRKLMSRSGGKKVENATLDLKCPPQPLLRSQEEVSQRFAPIMKKEGKIYRKSVTSFIRRAVKGEEIVTIIHGKLETKNRVKDDSSWVVCAKAAGELYVLTEEQFRTNYETKSPKEISPNDPSPTSKQLRQQGFMEYQSRRKVWAHRVNESDMNFFHQGIDDETGGAYFVAPWGESMLVEQGDHLVMQYPDCNSEVYRVERQAFHDSYTPM